MSSDNSTTSTFNNLNLKTNSDQPKFNQVHIFYISFIFVCLCVIFDINLPYGANLHQNQVINQSFLDEF